VENSDFNCLHRNFDFDSDIIIIIKIYVITDIISYLSDNYHFRISKLIAKCFEVGITIIEIYSHIQITIIARVYVIHRITSRYIQVCSRGAGRNQCIKMPYLLYCTFTVGVIGVLVFTFYLLFSIYNSTYVSYF